MKTWVLLTIVQVLSSFSHAYILPLETILAKTASSAGNSIVAVEQNVTFSDGSRQLVIKEEWLIEGDKNLRLNAVGTGELKDVFSVHYLYNSKARTHLSGKNKVVSEISRDFFEKFLAIKSKDSYLAYLKDLNIPQKVRLSRASGAISFAIGEPSNQKALSPQIWIDQDFFRLNKIRFPSEAEVEFSEYQEYEKLHYPKIKKVDWAGNTVTIQVTRVNEKAKNSIRDFYADTLELPSETSLAGKGPLGAVIEDFYKRFR